MNWGYKITIGLGLFMGLIIVMVVLSFQQNIELVSENYYAKELTYNDKLQQKANTQSLKQKVQLIRKESQIIILFPEETYPASGAIHFYHLSQKKWDKKLKITVNTENRQVINSTILTKGRYRVNISWHSNEKSYFQQEKLMIP